MTKPDPRLDIARCMQIARKECGKGLFAQIEDMVSLVLGPGKLKPSDYYYYGLYGDARFSGDVNLPQLATGAGLLDDRFRKFLDGIK